MKIEKPEIRQQGNKVVASFPVESSAGTSALWYSLDEKFADFVTDAGDAPLTTLLIPAMAAGEDIHIAAPVSERLFYNLSDPYQRLLQCIFPFLHRINIYPADLQQRTERAPGVAAGFSGGIDSFAVLADHHYAANVPHGFRVSHLLFTNVGSHGRGEKGVRKFSERSEHIRGVAARIGLPLIIVDSNMSDFYPHGLGYVQTLSHRNAAIPLLLQAGIGRSLIASSYSYKDVFIGVANNMTYSDLVTFPMLSTEVLDILSVGSQYTRIEKTLRLAEVPDTYSTLDVCFRQSKDGNCSVCQKCVRTLFTLEIAGLLERYSPSFDLDAYRRARNSQLRIIALQHDPLFDELIPFARERHFRFPFHTKALAWLSKPFHKYSGKYIKLSRKVKTRLSAGSKRPG
jgi:hypothetical protein